MKHFWMARLDEVFVVLEHEFNLAIGHSAVADELNNRFGDWNLEMRSESGLTVERKRLDLGQAVQDLDDVVRLEPYRHRGI